MKGLRSVVAQPGKHLPQPWASAASGRHPPSAVGVFRLDVGWADPVNQDLTPLLLGAKVSLVSPTHHWMAPSCSYWSVSAVTLEKRGPTRSFRSVPHVPHPPRHSVRLLVTPSQSEIPSSVLVLCSSPYNALAASDRSLREARSQPCLGRHRTGAPRGDQQPQPAWGRVSTGSGDTREKAFETAHTPQDRE